MVFREIVIDIVVFTLYFCLKVYNRLKYIIDFRFSSKGPNLSVKLFSERKFRTENAGPSKLK